ncbi:hypothetical protein JCM8547_005502 [Rhodosporidiobolus lusitaniae]
MSAEGPRHPGYPRSALHKSLRDLVRDPVRRFLFRDDRMFDVVYCDDLPENACPPRTASLSASMTDSTGHLRKGMPSVVTAVSTNERTERAHFIETHPHPFPSVFNTKDIVGTTAKELIALGVSPSDSLFIKVDNWHLTAPLVEVLRSFDSLYVYYHKMMKHEGKEVFILDGDQVFPDQFSELMLRCGLSNKELNTHSRARLATWLREQFPLAIELFAHLFYQTYARPRELLEKELGPSAWHAFMAAVRVPQVAGHDIPVFRSWDSVVAYADFLFIASEAFGVFNSHHPRPEAPSESVLEDDNEPRSLRAGLARTFSGFSTKSGSAGSDDGSPHQVRSRGRFHINSSDVLKPLTSWKKGKKKDEEQ